MRLSETQVGSLFFIQMGEGKAMNQGDGCKGGEKDMQAYNNNNNNIIIIIKIIIIKTP